MNWSKCHFVKGILSEDNFCSLNLTNIVFLGRSNVGKSSLINCLFNNNNLAKTSKTPGKTQEMNLFLLDNKIQIIDCPGYGYAKKSKELKNIWVELFIKYLRTDIKKRLFFILIDYKVGFKDSDIDMIYLLGSFKASFVIVFTKCDKRKSSNRVEEHLDYLRVSSEVYDLSGSSYQKYIDDSETIACDISDIVCTSSQNRIGVQALKGIVEKFHRSI